MKKLLASFFTLLILISSCEPKQDLIPINNLEAEISFLKEMNTVGLNLAVSDLAKYINPGERNEIRLNQRELVRDILSGLNGPFFQTEEKFILDFSKQYGDSNLPFVHVNLRETGFVDLSTFGVYSEDQLNLVQPFVDALFNNDDFSFGKSRTIEFQLTIVNSSLSYDEKFQLLAFNAGVISLIDFLENGGVEDIRIILAQELGFIGAFDKVTGCSISTRSIFADGVVGLIGGAAGGCYAGATAGTVAFPLLGTVTGCVGAGVVGGAGGFISGIAYGIASQLLTSCFR